MASNEVVVIPVVPVPSKHKDRHWKDNHRHVVLQLNDAAANAWSDEDVVRRWGRLFPPRGKVREPLETSERWVAKRLKDAAWPATARVTRDVAEIPVRLGSSAGHPQERLES